MSEHGTLSVAVMSGKGGVGKSGFALNLGYALHLSGERVLMLDCDMGLANLDVLLGLSPEHTLYDLLHSNLEASDVVVSMEEGLDLLPSASGVEALAGLDEDAREVLRGKLGGALRRYQHLILDLSAGMGEPVLAISRMARARVLVVTPEPTSLTDGYAMMKVLNRRWGVNRFDIVVNMAESRREGRDSFDKLGHACDRFLGFSPRFLGSVARSRLVREAVERQQPFLKLHPDSPPSRDIVFIAEALRRRRRQQPPDRHVLDWRGSKAAPLG